MSLYTRQYTNDVGWQNEPSTATPINSTNLNKMDDAIGNVDAAVKSAFDSVETSLANAGGVSMGNKITSFSTTYNSMETDIAFDDSIANHDGAVFFLTSDDEGAENQNGWKIRVNWVNGSSTTITRLPVLNVSPQTMSDVFTDAVAEGDVVIARLVIEDPADSSTWRCDLLAHISASANGGGIGAECSGHAITGLASDNDAINAGILFDDDIINHDTHIFFLTSEYAVPEKSDAPYYWRLWVRYKMGSTTVGQSIMIYDMAGNAFDDAIPVGNEFICQLHLVDPSDSTTWYVSELANISAGGGGGSSIAYNGNVTSASNDVLIASLLRRTSDFNENDLIFLHLDVDATWEEIEFVNKWKLQYYVNNEAVSKNIDNGMSLTPYFNYDMLADTWLVLKAYTSSFTCIAKIDPSSGGASTLADLTDTDISSPADGQVLMHNGTEWENADIPAPAVATSAAVGVVKPDNETITIDNDGTIHGQEIVPVGAGYWTISNGKATWVGGEITGSWTVANGKATWVPAI